MAEVPSPPPGFDWDPPKYVSNVAKHGIKFDQAIGAFADLNGFDYDIDWQDGEPRYAWLGRLQGIILYIAYTLRGGDGEITRVISARRATKAETDAYFVR